MPPVSPCGQVVDYVRSCKSGFWRFFPSRPDLLTSGYHYFAPEGTRSIEGPHSFGSCDWLKDGMLYPEYPTGQLQSAGSQWYNGQEPEPIPPNQNVFPIPDFSRDQTYPPEPVVLLQGGFDARCFIVRGGGVPIDVDDFLRPDITDCCWQRVLARLTELLVEPYAAALADFHAAVQLLWPFYRVVIFPPNTAENRWAWIEGPTFQLVLRVGSQDWTEVFAQAWHLNLPARDFGNFSTSPEWFSESSNQAQLLEIAGWNPEKPCYFVGHSRGAAVLWILARRMTDYRFQRQIEVLTFGCPRVGDERLIEPDFVRRDRHIVHRGDVIPLVPPNPPLWPILRTIFGWLNVDAFASWRPFRLYQITGDGWGRSMEPPGSLTLTTIIAHITALRQGQAIDPIAQHWLASYVAALAECCDGPALPFTRAFWNILFGDADIAPGGGMWGGAGVLPDRTGTGGVLVGGGVPYTHGDGGLQIGGGGDQYSGIITESAEPMISESGDYLIVE